MARFARWATMIVSTGAAFLVSLWMFRFASFQWMPHDTADRWVVAAAFATVAASAVGAATAWWAGRDRENEKSGGESQRIKSVGSQAIKGCEGAVFGPLGDYRGAVFNVQSAASAEPESPSTVEERPQTATLGDDSQAKIIPFRGKSAPNQTIRAGTHSWVDLAETLRWTSLEGEDWVAVSAASRYLQTELQAIRYMEPGIPESVPQLAIKLRDLLKIITDPSTPPDQFSARLAEAQRAKDYLLRLLTPKSG